VSQHHDEDSPRRGPRSPANRLGLDYREVPAARYDGRIVDVHTHVRVAETTEEFLAAADLYGIDKIVTMSPLDDVPRLQDACGERLDFIAVPRFRDMDSSDAFRAQWLRDLEAFRALGARRMKFWMAPPMRGHHGLTLEDPFFEPLIQTSLDLGYDFMVHIADPTAWFEPGGRYADAKRFGTKAEQYPQLEFLLQRVAPRSVIAAHLGGNIEDPDFLQGLLDRHANLCLDSSATKWIVRGVAPQPERVRALLVRNADRILFGSDLVVADHFDFEHYASRFWVHQMMWQSDYRGESPIEDPDADDPPRLAGLALPAEVLRPFYDENAARLGY
jgi:hypothetical protein